MSAKKHNISVKIINQLLVNKKFNEALEASRILLESYPSFGLYNRKHLECLSLAEKSSAQQITLIQSAQKDRLESASTNSEQFASNFNSEESLCRGTRLAEQGKTTEARRILSHAHQNDKSNGNLLLALAKVDILDSRFSDALIKAKAVLKIDNQCRDAYRIAEQSAIELEKYDEANNYFLSQPPVQNPPEPRVRGVNPALDPRFVVKPVIGHGNDYSHILNQAELYFTARRSYKKTVSIIVPVYNRSQILANTLAALTHQTYPKHLIEIIVVDDGSSDDVLSVIRKYESRLKLYYCRQSDQGFRPAAARNLGLKQARGDAIVFLDADILPAPEDIESYMRIIHVSDSSVLIGHRRYVDVSNISDDRILENISCALELHSINPNNDVADRRDAQGVSFDWRYEVYEKTNYLKNDLWPFTKAAGGNIAFSRKLVEKAGYMDEDFTDWGCEDSEYGYRMYNSGAYFIPLMSVVSLHQEPLDKIKTEPAGDSFRKRGHAITRVLFAKKCPAPTVRSYPLGATFEIPKVSIYIPAHNAEKYIYHAVKSCLDQNYGDLEICICNDGSTDSTLDVIKTNFSDNEKVRWISQENKGIGAATNAAIRLCRGMYIGQLDADDLLKPTAVQTCVEFLDKNNVDAVYTDCDYIDREGKYIRDSWCGGDYSREWLATGMIATHFRMFRKRLWSRTSGADESITNAVDLDLWLKFHERGKIKHIHQILYSYRWHGLNTSIAKRKQQEINHLKVVTNSLRRQKLDRFWKVESTNNKFNPREFKIIPNDREKPKPEDIFVLIPTCLKYKDKANAIRQTWAKQLGYFGYRFLFLIGDPKLSNCKVISDTLFVPCEDNYESLLLKLVLGYKFLYQTSDFSYIFKIDDDCYPNLGKITKEILPQLLGSQYFAGQTHPKGAKLNNKWHYGKCSRPDFDRPYPTDVAKVDFGKGGYGYFLRRDALPVLIEKEDLLREELAKFIYSYEDVRIAQILLDRNILVKKLDRFSVIKEEENNSKEFTLIFDLKASSFRRIHAQNN